MDDDDIVDRLREYAALEKHSIYASRVMFDAANEIERLRSEEQHLLDEIAYLKSAMQEIDRHAEAAIETAKANAAIEMEQQMRDEFRNRGWTRHE